MPALNTRTRPFLILVIGLGALSAGAALSDWHFQNSVRFFFYLLLAVLGSGFKVSLPGIPDALSAGTIFTLLSIVELSAAQAVLIAATAACAHCILAWRGEPGAIRIAFHTGAAATCALIAFQVYRDPVFHAHSDSPAVPLLFTTAAYFFLDSLTSACIVGLDERCSIVQVWIENFKRTGPQFLVSVAVTLLLHAMNGRYGWEYSALIVPAVYMVYRSYEIYIGKLEQEKNSAAEAAGLHRRTIEALALAIEAKDDTTHAHLRRVEVYALEIGRALNLSHGEIQALQAASLLHDIGKLAVPEYIINKPGRLTREEFEKMKIHPVVGAEILEQVRFPFPVAPIVRSHHEKWDGTGYPDGLRGEQIPIGARIISAVDCFDALASHRQYRRALPFEEALDYVASRAGSDFDPAVIAVLTKNAVEFERKARAASTGDDSPHLSTRVRIHRGDSPGAGLAQLAQAVSADYSASSPAPTPAPSVVAAVATAHQEFQTIQEVARDLGKALSLEETLALMATRLQSLVPFDGIAFYHARGDELVPLYTSGVDQILLAALRIPVGDGLSGWVVQNRMAIVNGNPDVETSYLHDPSKFTTLRSAVSVPLEPIAGSAGALTLYSLAPDAFSSDHLRILTAVSARIALIIDAALNVPSSTPATGIDSLTGLADAPALFHGIEQRLSSATGDPFAVILVDLDNFKNFNHRYGHPAGNEMLQSTAAALRQMFRAGDLVARTGADDFAIVATGMGPDVIEARCRNIARVIARLAINVCGEPSISVSTGDALYPADGATPEALLGEAQKRLYLDRNKKANGQESLAPLPVESLINS